VHEQRRRIDLLSRTLQAAVRGGDVDSKLLRVRRGSHVYHHGQEDRAIYLVDSGEVKAQVTHRDGRECITELYGPSDIFGEMCLCGEGARTETAIALHDCVLRRVSVSAFTGLVHRESLHVELVQYLATRLVQQQETIATLVTGSSEYRLATMLLRLARRLARQDREGAWVVPKLRQDDLADMVGTTRTRVGVFLKKFRALGLVRLNPDNCLVVEEVGLERFLEDLHDVPPA
jgi:CRP/FNR family transcriptional regulator, cyclic AMP receptor protein